MAAMAVSTTTWHKFGTGLSAQTRFELSAFKRVLVFKYPRQNSNLQPSAPEAASSIEFGYWIRIRKHLLLHEFHVIHADASAHSTI